MITTGRPQIRIRIAIISALLILAAATMLRISEINHLPDQGFFAKYTEIAQDILSGDTPHDRLGDVSNGYLWIVILGLGPLGMNIVALRTAQIIAVSLAAAACGAAAWRRWGIWAGFGAATVLMASRAALVNATEIEPETLILLSTSIGLGLIVAFDQPRFRAIAGIALGIAAITRPSLLLPIVLAIVGIGWRTHPKKRMATILPLVLGVTLPILANHAAITVTTENPPTPMNPGTVFFEGWNALATGYLGEAPVVIKDVEHALGLPDGLHVAYRIVAARASNQQISPENSNSYWTQRAFAFMRYEPRSALSLGIRKAVLGISSFDSWDLKTLHRKAALLGAGPYIPFAFLFALGALGLCLAWRQPWTLCLGLWVGGGWMVMVLFYVTARQRNVLLPAIALLAGAAINSIATEWHAGHRRRIVVALCFGAFFGLLLTLEGTAQKEDQHGWHILKAQEISAHEASTAHKEDNRQIWLARSATFLDPEALKAANPRLIEQEVRSLLTEDQTPQRYFDLALVMLEIGQYRDAERLLRALDAQGYQPRRGARWCSSIAYHLARCRAASSDFSEAQSLVKQALRQSPGDPRALALEAVLSEYSGATATSDAARNALASMYDPFTKNQALAQAYLDTGRPSIAVDLMAKNRERLPEWNPWNLH